MTDAQNTQILTILEHVRKRPGMYFSDQVPAVANFLNGFVLACSLFEETLRDNSAYHRALVARGWEITSTGVWVQMAERGYDEAAIIQEMLIIYEATFAHAPDALAELHLHHERDSQGQN
jgi:hypothetical protein